MRLARFGLYRHRRMTDFDMRIEKIGYVSSAYYVLKIKWEKRANPSVTWPDRVRVQKKDLKDWEPLYP